jgi:predicted dehydrogenase
VERKVKVGIIGTGNIFGRYVERSRAFEILDVVACADIDHAKAQAKAAAFDIPRVYSVEDLLSDPEVEIVVNLTVPTAHAEVSLAAIEAGKHVYSEKPLAVAREDGRRVLDAAREKGVRVGCAPDTFLGGGLQTCRKLVDDGWIGEPVAAVAFMVQHGPESWHPNPDFFYQEGAGPLFDMGPYYLTSLMNLLGPVKRVAGSARISFAERIATCEEQHGRRIPVEVPTHTAGVLDFASGPIATLITSFDVWASRLPRVEVYGSEGTLSTPDPNVFGGPVLVRRAGAEAWREMPLSHNADVGRGIGVADMAYAIRYDRPHRARGDVAFHVLDVMQALGESSEMGKHIEITSHCDRPAPLPLGLVGGELDA